MRAKVERHRSGSRDHKKFLLVGRTYTCPTCGWVIRQAASNNDVKRNILCECPPPPFDNPREFVMKTITVNPTPNWDGDAERLDWSCGEFSGQSEGSSLESVEQAAISDYRQASGDTEDVQIEYEDHDDGGYEDDDMDGDAESALASCGWGTDEDYGDYGGEDF